VFAAKKNDVEAQSPMKKLALGGGVLGRRKSSNTGQSFVVMLGDEGAILLYVRGNKVLRRLFAPSPMPEHIQSMVELLQKHAKVPLYIMLDTIDQQYLRQTFPPVSALSVSKLVERRLERDFASEDIKGAIPLGREKDGRREWSYLLISVANGEALQAWLSVLLEQPNECKGIYLTPVEAQQYAVGLMREAMPHAHTPWQLFVSHNKVGGVRQVVLYNGKLAFTRLTQLVDDNNHELTAGNIEQEIQNTIDYLRRLNFDDNADMSMLVVASQEINEHLDVQRFNLGAARAVTPFDAANLLNIEQAALSGDRFGDAVIGAAFATSKKRLLPLFTPYAQRLAKLYKARLGGKLLTAIVVLYAICASVMAMLGYLDTLQKELAVTERLATQRAQLTQAKQTIGTLDKDVSLWASVVALYDVYQPAQHMPFSFVTFVAEQLQNDIRPTNLAWSAPYEEPEAVNARSRRGRGGATSTHRPVTVNMDVAFTGDYKTQERYVEVVETFFTSLQSALTGYKVEAVNLPGRKDPKETEVIAFDNAGPAPFDPSQNVVSFTFEKLPDADETTKGGAR
jgi:hypothetical protein